MLLDRIVKRLPTTFSEKEYSFNVLMTEVQDKILEDEGFEEAEYITTEMWFNNTYIRGMEVMGPCCVFGKTHLYPHITVVTQGSILLTTANQDARLMVAGDMIACKEGEKKMIRFLEAGKIVNITSYEQQENEPDEHYFVLSEEEENLLYKGEIDG